ncbi:MAG: MFS transporter, partial [Planctomycetes bacterium]|nr:MFS transporter [Planctomycetota bacterium]
SISAVWIILGLVLLAHIFGAGTTTCWLSWVSDLAPDKMRGRFFGRRNMLGKLSGMSFSFAFGAYLRHRPAPEKFFHVMVCCALVGLCDIWIHTRVPDPPMARRSAGFFSNILVPLRDRNYRHLIAYMAGLNFAVFVAGPFFYPFLLRDLDMGYLQIALYFELVQYVAFAVSYWVWGYFIDRFGNKPVLLVCSAGIVTVSLIYLPTARGLLWPLAVMSIVSGTCWAGQQIALVNLQIGLPPRESRASYIAAFLLATGLASVLGCVTGGAIATIFADLRATFLGFPFSEYKLLFILSSALRLLPLIPLARLEEAGCKPVGYVLRAFRTPHPFKLFYALHSIDRAERETDHRRAIRTLASARSILASDRLLEAAADPDPEVRHEAIEGLARLRDPEVSDELIEKLREASHEIRSAAAETLGRTRDPGSIPLLLRQLQSPDPDIRQGAAAALGEIGDPAAAVSLRERLATETDPGVAAAVARALGQFGSLQGIASLLPLLERTADELVRSQIGIAIGNIVGDPGTFYGILARERRTTGSGGQRLAARTLRRLRGPSAGVISTRVREIGRLLARGLWEPALSITAEVARGAVRDLAIHAVPDGFADPSDYEHVVATLILWIPQIGARAWFIETAAARRMTGPLPALLALHALAALIRDLAQYRETPDSEEPG